MLAGGGSLMARPKMLLVDEPSLGLAPVLVQAVFAALREINRQGVTILLVEQNVRQTLLMVQRGYVLENGRIVLEGAGAGGAALLRAHPRGGYAGPPRQSAQRPRKTTACSLTTNPPRCAAGISTGAISTKTSFTFPQRSQTR